MRSFSAKRRERTGATAAAVVIALALTVRPSLAHPNGSTSVNRYVGVSCSPAGEVRIAYLLDFAELPAYAEIEQLDADHDGAVTPEEQRAYLERRLPPLVGRWLVEVNGSKASLRISGRSLQVLPGDQGLSTLRIAADIAADVPPSTGFAHGGDLRVHVVDSGFADRSGWRQMTAEASTDVTVVGGSAEFGVAGRSSPSGDPPRVDDAVFTFRARVNGGRTSDGDAPYGPGPIRATARLARWLIAVAVTLALAFAIAWRLGHRGSP
ncbi:MAG TPA: hypothetical protein VII82_09045 [Polyangiaceae bacterium]|jgi:hypothetical protein